MTTTATLWYDAVMDVVNGWVIVRRFSVVPGRSRVVAECPSCHRESDRRLETLVRTSTCRDCYLKSRTKGGNRTARGRVVYNYKHICAKGRSLPFELSSERLDELFQSNCHYCSSGPSNVMHYKRSETNTETYIYNGIDRIDSAMGYVEGNVVAACSICNRAKGALPYDEFMSWIGRIK